MQFACFVLLPVKMEPHADILVARDENRFTDFWHYFCEELSLLLRVGNAFPLYLDEMLPHLVKVCILLAVYLLQFQLPYHFDPLAQYELIQFVLSVVHLHAVSLQVVGVLADLEEDEKMARNNSLALIVVAAGLVSQLSRLDGLAYYAVAEAHRYHLKIGYLILACVVLDIINADFNLLEKATVHPQLFKFHDYVAGTLIAGCASLQSRFLTLYSNGVG